MSKVDRSIRLSQVISNYGVGSIYDILGESLVLTDTRVWLNNSYQGKGKEIKAERLIANLNISGFPNLRNLNEPAKAGSFGRSAGTLPFMRFPRWLFCSKCRRMKKWTFRDEKSGESPVCDYCAKSPKLTPMRFITICEDGHMHDVDWFRWAHSRQNADHQRTCQQEDLEFVTGDVKVSGLGSIAVKCRSCGAGRSLEGITAPNVLRSIGVTCSGKQPWQGADRAVKCDSRIHVVQRGAGNVYYPVVKSAITIPPESKFELTGTQELEAAIKDHPLMRFIPSDNEAFQNHVISQIAEQVKCKPSDVLNFINGASGANVRGDSDSIDIETEEWDALTTEMAEVDDRDKFVTRHIPFNSSNSSGALLNCIDKVVSVIKLREVRALAGFYRYHPGGTEENAARRYIKPDIDGTLTWLPAAEVYGEGIFLSLNEKLLQKWEQTQEVIERANILVKRVSTSSLEYLLPEITPRYVLLHTLAHILIRRLAFECGYSSASLRERIYSRLPINKKNAQAGILIYTAAGDAEGTLGGLSRQAEHSRFTETLISALQDAANCSADPICMESKGQGVDSLNLAACHACTLVAETSCTSFNLALDRALVLGDNGVQGFFQELLQSALETTIKSV